ncbi:hypothetical protein BCT00_01060 [Vibrio breoganii]|nr:hypothetical protein BCT00_01060 [Vibrio breoganii]
MDLAAFRVKFSVRHFLLNDMVKFYIYLRLLECCKVKTGTFYKLSRWRFGAVAKKLGFSIPIGVIGPGLRLPHYGTIVINTKAKIGSNCHINVGVVIGSNVKDRTKAPIIGDNCYIGAGAKIIGNVVLGDNVVVGANAVVTKSFPDGNCSLVGIPANVLENRC